MESPDHATLDRLLRGVDIPPCPAVLLSLQQEIASPNGSLGRIAQIVGTDVALAASVLKVANSPALGLSRHVGSISQAVSVLGMRALSALTAGIMLRAALSGGSSLYLERFWDSAARVASLCANLSREFRGVPTEMAYSFGLFHDCGIAVLMKRFPSYTETLESASAAYDQSFTSVEEAHHATNHAAVGYFLTRTWGLPEEISKATLLHHDLSIFDGDADHTAAQARTLVSFATLAEHIAHSQRYLTDDTNWILGKSAVMAHLGISEQDVCDLKESYCDL